MTHLRLCTKKWLFVFVILCLWQPTHGSVAQQNQTANSTVWPSSDPLPDASSSEDDQFPPRPDHKFPPPPLFESLEWQIKNQSTQSLQNQVNSQPFFLRGDDIDPGFPLPSDTFFNASNTSYFWKAHYIKNAWDYQASNITDSIFQAFYQLAHWLEPITSWGAKLFSSPFQSKSMDTTFSFEPHQLAQERKKKDKKARKDKHYRSTKKTPSPHIKSQSHDDNNRPPPEKQEEGGNRVPQDATQSSEPIADELLERQLALMMGLYLIDHKPVPLESYLEQHKEEIVQLPESAAKRLKGILNGERISDALFKKLPNNIKPAIFLTNPIENRNDAAIPDFTAAQWENLLFSTLESSNIIFKRKITGETYSNPKSNLNITETGHIIERLIMVMIDAKRINQQFPESHFSEADFILVCPPEKLGNLLKILSIAADFNHIKSAYFFSEVALAFAMKESFPSESGNFHIAEPGFSFVDGLDGHTISDIPSEIEKAIDRSLNLITAALKSSGVTFSYQFYQHTNSVSVTLEKELECIYQTPPLFWGYMPVYTHMGYWVDPMGNTIDSRNFCSSQDEKNDDFQQAEHSDSTQEISSSMIHFKSKPLTVQSNHAIDSTINAAPNKSSRPESPMDWTTTSSVEPEQEETLGLDLEAPESTATHSDNTEPPPVSSTDSGIFSSVTSFFEPGNTGRTLEEEIPEHQAPIAKLDPELSTDSEEENNPESLACTASPLEQTAVEPGTQSEIREDLKLSRTLYHLFISQYTPWSAWSFLMKEEYKELLKSQSRIPNILSHLLWYAAREVPDALELVLNRITYYSQFPKVLNQLVPVIRHRANYLKQGRSESPSTVDKNSALTNKIKEVISNFQNLNRDLDNNEAEKPLPRDRLFTDLLVNLANRESSDLNEIMIQLKEINSSWLSNWIPFLEILMDLEQGKKTDQVSKIDIPELRYLFWRYTQNNALLTEVSIEEKLALAIIECGNKNQKRCEEFIHRAITQTAMEYQIALDQSDPSQNEKAMNLIGQLWVYHFFWHDSDFKLKLAEATATISTLTKITTLLVESLDYPFCEDCGEKILHSRKLHQQPDDSQPDILTLSYQLSDVGKDCQSCPLKDYRYEAGKRDDGKTFGFFTKKAPLAPLTPIFNDADNMDLE